MAEVRGCGWRPPPFPGMLPREKQRGRGSGCRLGTVVVLTVPCREPAQIQILLPKHSLQQAPGQGRLLGWSAEIPGIHQHSRAEIWGCSEGKLLGEGRGLV